MIEFSPGLRGAALVCAGVLLAVPARAQGAPTTSEGPGRITCSAPAKCMLGIGTPPSMRFAIDGSGLPDADKARMAACTAKASPCIATVTGVEAATGMRMKASAIKWFN
jgi:hypothetical protein